MHLRQPGFTYSASGPFTKNKERIQNLKQPGFTYSASGPFTKNKERIQNLKKQKIQNIFIKMY